jgi:hypothetical protein
VLKRSDEYGHAAINAVSVLKKLRTVLFLVLVGMTPASGCLYFRFLLYRFYIFRASRVSNLLWRMWDLVLKRSDEYWHAAINAVSALKKLRTALFLVLVGMMPASGCHYLSLNLFYRLVAVLLFLA